VTEVSIARVPDAQIDGHLDEIADVYAAALGEDPVAARERMRTDVLPRHRARDGFRLLVARDGERIVGMAYGYIGARGQWWTERVAAAMSADEQARWLDAPHFEVVELHVHPDAQGRGIGARLLSELLDGLGLPFALLSTAATNTRGRAFYRREGWTEIVPSVDLSSWRGPYVILARQLQ
jgi:ribosomal protein S18 acetylase RimI-like enzyme